MSSPTTLREALSASPSLFPLNQNPNGDLVQVVGLSEADYESASFLDSRILSQGTRQAVIPWPELEQAASDLPRHCNFIFHISHAGSTLLSRLLGTHPSCFALREPGILRLLGQSAFPERLNVYLGLWSRTFRPEQIAMIKATSFVSEIGTTLLATVVNSRALLMYVPLETFLPALLDGAMSDIDSQAASRLSRLQRRGRLANVALAELSPGERVAMSWLCEMVSLEDIAKQFPERTLRVDFDQFLMQPEMELQRSFEHFQLEADVPKLLNGPIMQRYAKKPEVNYDANFRSNLLAASQKKFSMEIDKGLAWLERFGAR